MKIVPKISLVLLAFAGAAVPQLAYSRVFFGLNFGIPLYPPAYYYPPPAYYAYPPVAVPGSTPVYVEQTQPQAQPQPNDAWYYCRESRAYYPYVGECAGAWQPVPARPPGM